MMNPEHTSLNGAGLALARYLWAWSRQDARGMCEQTQLTWLANHADAHERAFTRIGAMPLRDASRITVHRTAENLHTVTAEIVTEGRSGTMQFTLVREQAPYEPAVGGRWGVNPSSLKWL